MKIKECCTVESQECIAKGIYSMWISTKVIAKEASTKRIERHKQMFAVLSDEEKDTLIALLEKVNAHWDRLYRHPDGE